MKFEVRLVLSPPWLFGLPDGDATVVPSGTRITSPTLDTVLGTFAGHGTLSRYRATEDALESSGEVLGVHYQVRDNFVTASLEAEDHQDAREQVEALMSRLLQHLSVTLGLRITARVQGLIDENGDAEPTPRAFQMLTGRVYDLDDLSNGLDAAASFAQLPDQRLSTALRYYDAGLQVGSLLGPPDSLAPHATSPLIILEFLSFWKAIATVLGDPSRRQDNPQRRFRELGFGDDVKRRFDELKQVRDNSDVAHYSLDQNALDAVRDSLRAARTLAREVLEGYRKHLALPSQPPTDQHADSTDSA